MDLFPENNNLVTIENLEHLDIHPEYSFHNTYASPKNRRMADAHDAELLMRRLVKRATPEQALLFADLLARAKEIGVFRIYEIGAGARPASSFLYPLLRKFLDEQNCSDLHIEIIATDLFAPESDTIYPTINPKDSFKYAYGIDGIKFLETLSESSVAIILQYSTEFLYRDGGVVSNIDNSPYGDINRQLMLENSRKVLMPSGYSVIFPIAKENPVYVGQDGFNIIFDPEKDFGAEIAVKR